MDTSTSQTVHHGSEEQSSLEQSNLSQGTQDSFLKRKNDPSSLSSHGGGESGYNAGSSSASVLASTTYASSKSVSCSLSAPLSVVSDSQETVENSVSCVEDSVPLAVDSLAQLKPAQQMDTTNEITEEAGASLHAGTNMVSPHKQQNSELEPSEDNKDVKSQEGGDNGHSNKLNQSDAGASAEHAIIIESQEQVDYEQNDREVSSELLPLEPPHSPEVLHIAPGGDDTSAQMNTSDSPEISLQQTPDVPDSRLLPAASMKENSPEIVLPAQSDTNKNSANPTGGSNADRVEDNVPVSEVNQAMETDVVCTQNSFVLQIADSQCSVFPVSPGKVDNEKEIDKVEGIESSSKIEEVVATPEEIEEYERDFPNLLEMKRQNEPEDEPQQASSIKSGQENALMEENIAKEDNNPGNRSEPAVPTSIVSRTNISTVSGDSALASKGADPPLEQTAVKKRPVPLYESLVCDDSVNQNLNQTGTSQIGIGDAASFVEVEESMDTSQVTNSSE